METEEDYNEVLTVLISRASGDPNKAEISIDEIYNVHWDDVSGGTHIVNGYYSLFGYISYNLACRCGISCSGRHSYYHNDAKICIQFKINQSDQFKKGYQVLLNEAGPKPESKISRNRPNDAGPCTQHILKQLSSSITKQLTREKIRNELYTIGYKSHTVSNAFRALSIQNKIQNIGSPNSKNQIIILNSTNPK